MSIQALDIGDFLFYRLNYWWNLKNNYLLIIIQTLAAVLLRCSLNEHYFIGASQSRRVSIISAACQHCYSSQYLVAKETCCQPPRLSLSLRCLPLPYCPWPEGTVGFLNALPPFVSTHWLALCSPKSRAAWGAGCSFLLVLLKKKKIWRKRKKKRGSKSSGVHHNLSRYVCSLCLPLLQ